MEYVYYYLLFIYLSLFSLTLWELIYIRKLFKWWLRVEHIASKGPRNAFGPKLLFPQGTMSFIYYDIPPDYKKAKYYKLKACVFGGNTLAESTLILMLVLFLAWITPFVIIWASFSKINKKILPWENIKIIFRNERQDMIARKEFRQNLNLIIGQRHTKYRESLKVEKRFIEFISPQSYKYFKEKAI